MKKTENGWIELLKIAVMAVVVFLPVVFLCLFIRFRTMDYSDEESPYYFWNRDFTKQTHDRYYSTLILGDSAANAAYLPEAMSEGTINLSLGGTTVIENYYVLQDWLNHQEAPKTVYLSFMDYHLLYDSMFYERTVYAHRLSYEQEKEILENAKEFKDQHIALEDADSRLLEYNLYLPRYYLPALLNAGFTGRREENEAHYAAVDLHRGSYIGLTSKMYSGINSYTFSDYPVSPLFDRYYRKVLDLCSEYGIDVRIVILPKACDSVITDEYRSARDDYYEDLISQYRNVTYVHDIETSDLKYFLDWEHFNIYGGWIWSNYIRNRFPQDFEEEPMSDRTAAGISEYIKLTEEPGLSVDFANGRDIMAIAITGEEFQLLERFLDTGKELSGRRVYLQNGADVSLMVNETDGDINTIALAENEDGTHSILLQGTFYPITIEPYADLTLIFINTHDDTPFMTRNYVKTGEGLVGK